MPFIKRPAKKGRYEGKPTVFYFILGEQMKEPKFRVGAEVYHLSKKQYGIVVGIINKNDPEDQVAQGFRYEVKIGGRLWSIPERGLSRQKGRPTPLRNYNKLGTR